jgi:hypothetical protein
VYVDYEAPGKTRYLKTSMCWFSAAMRANAVVDTAPYDALCAGGPPARPLPFAEAAALAPRGANWNGDRLCEAAFAGGQATPASAESESDAAYAPLGMPAALIGLASLGALLVAAAAALGRGQEFVTQLPSHDGVSTADSDDGAEGLEMADRAT